MSRMVSSSRFLLLLSLLFAAGALAAKPLKREVCVASCYYALLAIQYDSRNVTEQTLCSNSLRITSTYYCMAIHCQEADVEPGVAWWAATCKLADDITVEGYREAASGLTSQELSRLPTVDLAAEGLVSVPTVPSEHNWLVSHRSVYTYDWRRKYNNRIRWIPYAFWALVLLTGICNNAYVRLRAALRPRRDAEGGKAAAAAKPNALSRWIKTRITLAPTFSLHHHQPWGWFTVPLRLESIVIACHVIIQVALHAVTYRINDEDYYYDTRPAQVLRTLADRAGTLMSSSLPLLFLFGGRGNIFIILTGWSYRTFNVFHRWIARFLLLQAIVHGCVFSAFEVNDKGWEGYRESLESDDNYLYGIFSGVALGFTVALASGEVRRRAYEFFKATHAILAAILLAAFYHHIKEQFSGVYKVWAWICVGIWSGDRFLRLLRLVAINYKYLLGRDVTPATATYSEETGMIRLEVYPSVGFLRHTPGTYYQLSFPGWRLWESHPFSLAGWSPETGPEADPGTGASSPTTPSSGVVEKTSMSPPQVVERSPGSGRPSMTFMIRPRGGMTRRLRDRIRGKDASQTVQLRVLLEGPYGTPAQLGKFDDILFVAGGSGITAILPYIRSIFERGEKDGRHVPNVKLVWTVRNEAFIRDVVSRDLEAVQNSPLAAARFSAKFHVTGDSSPDASAGETDDGGRRTRGAPPHIEAGRLDVDGEVDGFLRASEGLPAVFVCGPALVADTARAAVLRAAKTSSPNVEFFEEMYGW